MNNPVIIHMSYRPAYKFDGWLFEYCRTKPFPPWPLKKDYELRQRAGRKFWKMIDRFQMLSIKDQEEFRL